MSFHPVAVAMLLALIAASPTPAQSAFHSPGLITYEADPNRPLPEGLGRALIQQHIRSANDCLLGRVKARLSAADGTSLGDLLVDAVPSCLPALHALIDAHDRTFGRGSGERFVEGPFLDQAAKLIRQSTR